MRPVSKWPVGQTNPPAGETILANYNPYGNANPLLQKNMGCFCSYCETFSSNLEVEHIISKHQDSTKETAWENFLLACGRCNGIDKKGNKHVDLTSIYLPHINNTLLLFEYKEGGLIGIHPGITDVGQKAKAEKLMNLVCLDKYPGNPKYPSTATHLQGFPINDKRWEHRREQWEKAVRKLDQYEGGAISAEIVAKFALERGFFSVWFSVFSAHREVKEALVNAFDGTDISSFDADYNPIPRNTANLTDNT